MKKFTTFLEDMRSALKEPVYISPIRRPDGTWIPAKTVMRKTNKKIVGYGSVHNGKDPNDDDV